MKQPPGVAVPKKYAKACNRFLKDLEKKGVMVVPLAARGQVPSTRDINQRLKAKRVVVAGSKDELILKRLSLLPSEMDSTPKQRNAIYRMRGALRLSKKGIHDLKFHEAAQEIEALIHRINTEGFPQRRNYEFERDALDDYGRRYES